MKRNASNDAPAWWWMHSFPLIPTLSSRNFMVVCPGMSYHSCLQMLLLPCQEIFVVAIYLKLPLWHSQCNEPEWDMKTETSLSGQVSQVKSCLWRLELGVNESCSPTKPGSSHDGMVWYVRHPRDNVSTFVCLSLILHCLLVPGGTNCLIGNIVYQYQYDKWRNPINYFWSTVRFSAIDTHVKIFRGGLCLF